MDEPSVVLVDDDLETEDLFEKVGFRRHREALDGGIGEARQADAKFARFAADLKLGDSLGVSTLKSISHSQQGRQFADTDAVVGTEGGVTRVVEAWS